MGGSSSSNTTTTQYTTQYTVGSVGLTGSDAVNLATTLVNGSLAQEQIAATQSEAANAVNAQALTDIAAYATNNPQTVTPVAQTSVAAQSGSTGGIMSSLDQYAIPLAIGVAVLMIMIVIMRKK